MDTCGHERRKGKKTAVCSVNNPCRKCTQQVKAARILATQNKNCSRPKRGQHKRHKRRIDIARVNDVTNTVNATEINLASTTEREANRSNSPDDKLSRPTADVTGERNTRLLGDDTNLSTTVTGALWPRALFAEARPNAQFAGVEHPGMTFNGQNVEVIEDSEMSAPIVTHTLAESSAKEPLLQRPQPNGVDIRDGARQDKIIHAQINTCSDDVLNNLATKALETLRQWTEQAPTINTTVIGSVTDEVIDKGNCKIVDDSAKMIGNQSSIAHVLITTRAQDIRAQRQARSDESDSMPVVPGVKLTKQWTVAALKEAQLNDAVISTIIAHLKAGTKPTIEEVENSTELKLYLSQWDSLALIQDLAYRIFHGNEGGAKNMQLLIPPGYKTDLMNVIHVKELGHGKAFPANARRLQLVGYWTTWKFDFKKFLACCESCYRNGPRREARVGPIRNKFHCSGPCELWCLDLIGPTIPSKGHKYILVVSDAFTKRVHLRALKGRTAEEICKHLTLIILQDGVPASLKTDNARELTSHIMETLCQKFGIAHLTSCFYSSRQNPVERWNSVVHAKIGRILTKHSDWFSLLPFVESAMNNSRSRATTFTANELHMGRQIPSVASALMAQPRVSYQSQGDFISETSDFLNRSYTIVQQVLQRTADYNRANFSRYKKQQQFTPGQKIIYFWPRVPRGQYKKWNKFYHCGTVESKINDSLYLIRPDGQRQKRGILMYSDKLKPRPEEEYITETTPMNTDASIIDRENHN